jgi:hippurate hydrolase
MVYPLVNNEAMVSKINSSLATVLAPEKIINNTPAVMGSEDFHHLVIHNKKAVYDFILVGTANPRIGSQSRTGGEKVSVLYSQWKLPG